MKPLDPLIIKTKFYGISTPLNSANPFHKNSVILQPYEKYVRLRARVKKGSGYCALTY